MPPKVTTVYIIVQWETRSPLKYLSLFLLGEGLRKFLYALLRIQGFLCKIETSPSSAFLLLLSLGVCTGTCAPTANLSCSYARAPPRLQLSSRARWGGFSLSLLLSLSRLMQQHSSCLFIHPHVSSFFVKASSAQK